MREEYRFKRETGSDQQEGKEYSSQQDTVLHRNTGLQASNPVFLYVRTPNCPIRISMKTMVCTGGFGSVR
jgi:hypothetical protein